jgi:hypothetical protein
MMFVNMAKMSFDSFPLYISCVAGFNFSLQVTRIVRPRNDLRQWRIAKFNYVFALICYSFSTLIDMPQT